MDEPVLGLRERTRKAVQAELQDVALDLFLTHGFEATTVDQISTAAGLSRRSFHRYFTNKEAVLAATLRQTGEQIAASLAARPTSEAPWDALRRAFDPLIEGMTADSRALPLTRMMLQTSAMQANHFEKQTNWRNTIADTLGGRLAAALPDPERRVQAEAISGAAISCLMTAQAEWVRQDGQTSLSQLVDLAMAAVDAA